MSARSNAKSKINQAIHQARQSLKMLDALEKEALGRVLAMVKIPNAEERKRLTNERVLKSLAKLGVATREEVTELRARIEKLEGDLAKSRSRASRSAAAAASASESESPAPATS